MLCVFAGQAGPCTASHQAEAAERLQNGRLVGAVTHVLVNDPTRGYGIFAQTMLEQAKNAVQNGDEAQTAE